jgi:hypothetical protein
VSRGSMRDSTGDLARVAPSVLFGNFSKVIANLIRYMQVLTLSSKHARAPGHRRPAVLHEFESCWLYSMPVVQLYFSTQEDFPYERTKCTPHATTRYTYGRRPRRVNTVRDL